MLESFLLNVAAELAASTLVAGGSRLGRLGASTEVEVAFREVLEEAFGVFLSDRAAGLGYLDQEHLRSGLSFTVRATPVAERLVDLVFAPDPPSAAEIQQAMVDSEVDVDRLPFDLETAVPVLVRAIEAAALRHAERPNSAIYNLVSTRLLVQLRGQRNVLPEKGALADASSATDLGMYLSRIARVFGVLRFPFSRMTEPIALDSVYVDPAIVRPRSVESLMRPYTPGQSAGGERVPGLLQLIQQDDRTALVGIMGTGKTTSLRHLCWLYSARPADRLIWRKEQVVPFFAAVRDVAELWPVAVRADGPGAFTDSLSRAVAIAADSTVDRTTVRVVLESALQAGNALVLLDALDEFVADERQRQQFVNSLQGVWDTHPFRHNMLVLTSRPHRFLRPHGFGQYLLYTAPDDVGKVVDRLGRGLLTARFSDSETFREAWLARISSVITAPRLSGFWSPFYVTLMVHLATSTETVDEAVAALGDIHVPADLFRSFLGATVQWEEGKGNTPGVRDAQAIAILARVAYCTWLDERCTDLLSKVATLLCDDITIEKIAEVIEFWIGTGLLWEDRLRGTVSFYHSGFQAYGTALTLRAMTHQGALGEVKRLSDKYGYDARWEEVWRLLAGMATNSSDTETDGG